jgi:hypothetical protein
VESTASTILWRLFKNPSTALRAGGSHIRAVILPGGPPFTLAFFADDQMDRAENYDEMPMAIFRAEEIKRSLLEDGWTEE